MIADIPTHTDGEQKARNGTVRDVAEFFRVKPRTIRKWQASRVLPVCKVGRNVMFLEEDIVALAVRNYIGSRKPAELAEMFRAAWRSCRAGNVGRETL